MENTKLNCKYCGAPLVVLNGETLVKCEYCGMTTVVEAPQGVAPLVEYGFMILENGRFEDADNAFENALKGAPRNSDAHLGKLMTEYKIKTRDEMKTCVRRFSESENYKNLMKYGSPEWINIVRNNNVNAIKQERDGYIKQLADMKQYHQIEENRQKKNIEEALKSLKTMKNLICILSAFAGLGLFLLIIAVSCENNNALIFMSIACFYIFSVCGLATLCFGLLKGQNTGKQSPMTNNTFNKKSYNYDSAKKRVKEANERLTFTCNSNRQKENELQNKIDVLQASIDNDEKKRF